MGDAERQQERKPCSAASAERGGKTSGLFIKGWLKGAVRELKEEIKMVEQRTATQTRKLVEGVRERGATEEQLAGWAECLSSFIRSWTNAR